MWQQFTVNNVDINVHGIHMDAKHTVVVKMEFCLERDIVFFQT